MVKPWVAEQQGLIRTPHDLLNLHMIDFSRLNGYFDNEVEAIEAIRSWIVGTTYYTVVGCDLRDFPDQPDWPNWKHPGPDHETRAYQFWNMFHARKLGTLVLSDSPDFQGTIAGVHGEPGRWFWGDIGRVSASAFSMTVRQMDAHDLWISVWSSTQQIVLEPLVSLSDMFTSMFAIDQQKPELTSDAMTANKYVQLDLF